MSPELTEHANLLHEGLQGFLEERGIDIGRGCQLATGLLPERSAEHDFRTRPRLLVVSGAIGAIRGLLFEEILFSQNLQDLYIAGLLHNNQLETRFSQLGMIGRGLAIDLLHKASPPQNLDERDIIKLSHSTRLAGPSDMTANSAEWLYQKVITQTLA